MASTNSRAARLKNAISQGAFFTASEEEILRLIRDAFPGELARLKNAKAIERRTPPPTSTASPHRRSPSSVLYDDEHDEINRTLVGVLTLRWIVNGEYDQFISNQPPRLKLQRDSFDRLQKFFVANLQSSEDIFTLVLSMIVNDLGKDPDLEEDYFELTHNSLQGQNHDAILYEAAAAGMISCLDLLDAQHKAEVMLGLRLGSELNAGQLAQAENVPINLECLLELKGHEHAFNLKFMEQILDVAGSGGHIDTNGARNLSEPVFQSFETVHEVAVDVIAERSTLREAYDKVLIRRGNMLNEKGFRRLSVSNNEQRALLRLLTMGRTTSLEQAELFLDAFDSLDVKNRDLLIEGLNVDGNENETAVLPYYMPAMLAELLENTNNMSKKARQRALAALMRYLTRVLNSLEPEQTVFDQNLDKRRRRSRDKRGPDGTAEINHGPIAMMVDANDNDSHEAIHFRDVFAPAVLRSSSSAPPIIRENQLDFELHAQLRRNRNHNCNRNDDNRSGYDLQGPTRSGKSTKKPAPGIVIERNMLRARETINSAAFRANPDVLDQLEVPRGQILQRRTSHFT